MGIASFHFDFVCFIFFFLSSCLSREGGHALDIHAPMRVMRRVPRVRRAGAMTMAMGVVLTDIRLALLGAQPIAMHTRQTSGEKEENGIQNTKRESGLQYRA